VLRRPRALLLALPVALLATLAVVAPSAGAPTSASTPVVVTMGDSYIVGEGGRWAGNTNRSSSAIDALGPTAYFDNAGATAELVPGCHRARTAEVHIGGGVTSINLACSGAKTVSQGLGSSFTPGLDFYSDSSGNRGQAAMLQEVATSTDVRLVVVSIGGNDMGFTDMVVTCASNFMLSSSLWPNYCRDDAPVLARITPAALTTLRTKVATALQNVRAAMRAAGRADGTYDVLVQTYPSPLPPGAGIRYSQSGYSRYTTGGCPFWNADADWANATVLPLLNRTVREAAVASGLQRLQVLDVSQALVGRRLCEKTVGLLEEKRLSSWTAPTAVDTTEWVARVRATVPTGSPYQVSESFHPNYWGQQGLQACLRLAWNSGTVRGGTCTIAGTGLVAGDPRMQLR